MIRFLVGLPVAAIVLLRPALAAKLIIDGRR